MLHKDGYSAHSQNLSFKKRLIEKFYHTVTEKMTHAGCSYFAHNIIENREEPAKPNNLPYWGYYWDSNSEGYKTYVIKKNIGYNCCKIDKPISPDNPITKNIEAGTIDKIDMCKMTDGFHFYIQHEDGIQENYSFGWEKHDADHISSQKLHNLTKEMDDLGMGFFRLTADMLGTYPAVY